MSELELVQYYTSSEQGYSDFVKEHKSRIFSVCLMMIKHREDAEDLTQETLISAIKGLQSFRGESKLSTWLYKLTVNTVLMKMRGRKRKLDIVSMDAPIEFQDQNKHNVHFDVPYRDLSLEGIIDKLSLQKALDSLPQGCREIFVMKEVLGYKHYEVAADRGCKDGNSKSQLNKAKRKLRAFLTSKPKVEVKHMGGVISDICEPCKEAGFPNIIAHYKEIPAGHSHTGKRIPAMCWDHRNNRIPRHIQEANTKVITQSMKPKVDKSMGDIDEKDMEETSVPVRAFNVHDTVISSVNVVKRRTRTKITEELIKQVMDLKAQNCTIAQVSIKLGLSHSTINRILMKYVNKKSLPVQVQQHVVPKTNGTSLLNHYEIVIKDMLNQRDELDKILGVLSNRANQLSRG